MVVPAISHDEQPIWCTILIFEFCKGPMEVRSARCDQLATDIFCQLDCCNMVIESENLQPWNLYQFPQRLLDTHRIVLPSHASRQIQQHEHCMTRRPWT